MKNFLLIICALFLSAHFSVLNAYSVGESLECNLDKTMLTKDESKIKISVIVKPPQQTNVDVVFSSATLKGFSVTIPTDDTGYGSKDKGIQNRNTIWESVAYWYDDSGLKAKADCGSLKKTTGDVFEWFGKGFEYVFGTIVISAFLAAGAGLAYKAIFTGDGRWKFILGLIVLIIVGILYSEYFPIII